MHTSVVDIQIHNMTVLFESYINIYIYITLLIIVALSFTINKFDQENERRNKHAYIVINAFDEEN